MPTPKNDKKLLTAIKRWLRSPRTVEEIELHFDVSRRTVYKYLGLLRKEGVDIRRISWERPTMYKVFPKK